MIPQIKNPRYELPRVGSNGAAFEGGSTSLTLPADVEGLRGLADVNNNQDSLSGGRLESNVRQALKLI